jgi:hypothetical protein
VEHQQPEAAHARRPHTPIAIDTLGKLREHGYGLWGSGLDYAALYRKDALAERQNSVAFEVDLAALIAERCTDVSCIRMVPSRARTAAEDAQRF